MLEQIARGMSEGRFARKGRECCWLKVFYDLCLNLVMCLFIMGVSAIECELPQVASNTMNSL